MVTTARARAGADELVKENVVRSEPLGEAWLAAALAAAAAALWLALAADAALPAARARAHTAPDQFSGEAAYEHLLNLTAIGPRVAGSFENEVLAVGALVAAVKRAAAGAAPHHRVELDVFTSDGAFPLAFLDGMNHVYRGVTSVAARVSARGARGAGAGAERGLLFNCHFDTVPDSPGASDDGAGCAVLLETLRALAAGRALRRPAVFLFNGAEENVLQASHGFVRGHRWARALAGFLNLEACGAGGREVVFQAGPRAGWLLAAYARAAPRPHASSLAQEIFRSGLIPADTDFRIFRDFGGLSGLDLAWAADGYAYHTRLDAPARVPPGALQRTGDNVLAIAQDLLWAERLDEDADAPQPLFFDVLGVWMVTLDARAAAGAAAALLLLLALDQRAAAADAAKYLYLPRREWARAVLVASGAVGAATAAGGAAAAAVALALAAADRRLACYARPWLLLPLYAAPALAAQWAVLRRALAAGARAPVRGWWAARAVRAAAGLWAGAALAAAAAAGLRAGFVPALWAAGAAAARGRGARGAAAAALAAAPAALHGTYLAAGSLRALAPLTGRAGAGALPAEAALGALTGLLTCLCLSWALPAVAAARRPARLLRALWAAAALAAALVLASGRGAAYSAEAPQRLMVFHTRRTDHAASPATADTFYWVPELDDNTAATLRDLGGAGGERHAARGGGGGAGARGRAGGRGRGGRSAGGPAGGAALGRAQSLLLRAARRARAATLRPHAADTARGRGAAGRGVGGAVRGRTRAVRGRARRARARAPAGRAARHHRAHRLGRRPAPLHRVARRPAPLHRVARRPAPLHRVACRPAPLHRVARRPAPLHRVAR